MLIEHTFSPILLLYSMGRGEKGGGEQGADVVRCWQHVRDGHPRT